MAKEGKTGLTIRDSTYQYAKGIKEEFNEQQQLTRDKITWDEIVAAGMNDIEDQGVVVNAITKGGPDERKRGISIRDEIYTPVDERKGAFPQQVTWDDIVVHGAERAVEDREDAEEVSRSEGVGGSAGLSDAARDEVREIVDERIDERIGDLEETLERELADVEAGVDDDRAKEIARDVSRAAIKEMVADGAIQHHHL